MLGAVLVGGDKGQVDLGLHGGGKVFLGLFSGFFQALQGHAVLGKVDAVFALEFFNKEVDDALVKVFATEEGVAVGGAHFNHVVAHFENGNIKRAAAKVEHGDLFVGFFVRTVGQRSRSGFVDDALDVKTGNAARVLGGLALGVVKVGGHGDDRFGNGFAKVGFCVGLQLGQNHGRNFGRAVGAAVHFHASVFIGSLNDGVGRMLFPAANFGAFKLAAHEALDGEHGALGVGNCLAFGNVANQTFLICKGHH